MKLTFAMGLQYDNSSRSSPAFTAPVASEGIALAAASEEIIIDVEAEPEQLSVIEFSVRHGFFFLTYNAYGVPEAVTEHQPTVDLFT